MVASQRDICSCRLLLRKKIDERSPSGDCRNQFGTPRLCQKTYPLSYLTFLRVNGEPVGLDARWLPASDEKVA
jgi:hypothetical protein